MKEGFPEEVTCELESEKGGQVFPVGERGKAKVRQKTQQVEVLTYEKAGRIGVLQFVRCQIRQEHQLGPSSQGSAIKVSTLQWVVCAVGTLRRGKRALVF